MVGAERSRSEGAEFAGLEVTIDKRYGKKLFEERMDTEWQGPK